jgi:hypothetical protein
LTTISGRNGMVYLQGSGTAATLVGEARRWRIQIDRDYDEDVDLNGLWKRKLPGPMSWLGTLEANVDLSDSKAFDAVTLQAMGPPPAWSDVAIYLYPDRSQPSRFYSGMVYCRLDVSVGIDGVARYQIDFDGNGALATN